MDFVFLCFKDGGYCRVYRVENDAILWCSSDNGRTYIPIPYYEGVVVNP